MARIQIADSTVAFDCAPDDTLARAGQRAGLGMPYECNVGCCGTCKVELVSGEVRSAWPLAPALNDRDRSKNRVLGCQAHPQGDCTIKVRLSDEYLPAVLPRRFRAKLLQRRSVTHDIGEFHWQSNALPSFKPGQYALFALPAVAGQRAYSMSNVAGDGTWQFQIKRVPGGQGTGALFDTLADGDEIELDGPYGNAWLREESPRDLVCIAGGSGISPMLSIVRGFAAAPAMRERTLHFFFGGRGPADICGEEELRSLAPFGQRIHFYPSISVRELDTDGVWKGAVGFVHEQVAATLAPLANYEFYFAGPPPMTQATQRMLIQAKVPFSQMHFDQFY